jgi:ubiquinone/menaquinone biosynthesis C-methylase UbiE
MTEPSNFSFSGTSVADAYDDILVPALFEPWAVRLVEGYPPWEDHSVLDLATGTGIVARLLAERVGPKGKVMGVDINSEMLSLANKRCAGVTPAVDFIESPAHPLDVSDGAVGVIVCQQGFQFFPDKRAAAGEMYRVLQDGGRVIVSTWRPVTECEFFGVICNALSAIKESEIADMMRVPFDFMPESELALHFESAGFVNVEVKRQEQDLAFSGGIKHAVEAAYSTPIAPKLRALPEQKQVLFQKTITELLSDLSDDGLTMGLMVSNVLSGKKPT